MTTPPMTPTAARTVLDAVIRQELQAAFDRGIDITQSSSGDLADPGTPDAIGAIALAVDNYGVAIIRTMGGTQAADGTEAEQ